MSLALSPTALLAAAAVTLAGLAALAALLRRDAASPDRAADVSRLRRAVVVGFVVAALAVAFLAPPDPFTQLLWFAPSLAAAVPLSYLALPRP